MADNDDLFDRWLAARRRSRPMRSLSRETAGTRSRVVLCLCRLRLFWPIVNLLLWLSDRLLRVVSRLYFGGLLSPRATRRWLRMSGWFGEAALALMQRRRRWNVPHAHKPRHRARF